MNPIYGVSSPLPVAGQPAGLAGPAEGDGAFKNLLLESIREVNAMQQDADRAVEDLVTGGEANPAEVLTAVQKADIAFRLMMQIRNKMVQAFQEVQNMRI